MGKGIGFPPVPYELNDLSKIERTFYDVDPKYLSMIAELSQPIVMACADIADQAGIELECLLNPNLPFTLADHVQFAVERLKKGVNLTTPIAYDIRHLYPKETAMADTALQMLREQAGLDLPDNEAINIAMHFINAEAESGDMHSLMLSMQAVSYTHLRAHETDSYLVCRLLLEKKKNTTFKINCTNTTRLISK